MKVIQGDLFDYAHSGYIIHQVNCQNAMGSGFAKSFFTHYSIIKTEYHHECQDFLSWGRDLLGHIQYVPLTPTLTGVNSFTQNHYGNSRTTGIKYTREDLLVNNIKQVLEQARKEGTYLYMPQYIGCDLAGGNWDTVMGEMELTNTDPLIIVGM